MILAKKSRLSFASCASPMICSVFMRLPLDMCAMRCASCSGRLYRCCMKAEMSFSAIGGTLSICVRLRMVGSISAELSLTSMKRVLEGGSSRILSMRLAATSFMSSGFHMSSTWYCASYGFIESL